MWPATMARFLGRLQYLLDLGRRHILIVDAADATAVQMNLEHDLRGRFSVLAEQLLQHGNHELMGVKSSLSITT
jgi:hypothetical protein